MNNRRFLLIFSFLVVVSLCACSKVQHVDKMLTLKKLSKEQEAMAQEVEEANKKFEDLKQKVRSGDIQEYDNQEEIVRAFGPPVIFEKEERNGYTYDKWLYRYATQFFGSDKVYLYFDSSGLLKEWRFVEGTKGGS